MQLPSLTLQLGHVNITLEALWSALPPDMLHCPRSKAGAILAMSGSPPPSDSFLPAIVGSPLQGASSRLPKFLSTMLSN